MISAPVLRAVKAALMGALLMAGNASAREQEAVIPVSATREADTLIIIWSGDGGWHGDLDVQLGKQFAQAGFDVIGFDTNIWFDNLRTDAEVAQKLSQIIEQYTLNNGVKKIVLLGWSYGADVLPMAYDRLSLKDQKLVDGIILLSVARLTQLQVTLAERTGLDPGHIPIEPELARIPRDKLACVYSEQEKAQSSCLTPAAAGATVMQLPGDHAFDHNAQAVAKALMPFIERVTHKPAAPKT